MKLFSNVHRAGVLVAAALAASSFNSCLAQTWDLPDVTSIIIGQPYDTTGASGLQIQDDHLYYVRNLGPRSPDPLDCGSMKMIYRIPESWVANVSTTLFGDAPAQSPTGQPIDVKCSVDAVAFQLDGPYFSGIVIGLLIDYKFQSGSETGTLAFLGAGALTGSVDEAKKLVTNLAGQDSDSPNPLLLAPSCEDQCRNTYNTDKKNARDRYVNNGNANCNVAAIGGALGGCATGAGVCGWLVPPASTTLCCVGGAILGSVSSYLGCQYIFATEYQTDIRIATRNFISCMGNCGIVIVEN